jgi:dihydrolipoamide dehydrogenase
VVKYGKDVFPWTASGRALSLGRDEGVTKLLFDDTTNRLLGCGIVGPDARDLIAETRWRLRWGRMPRTPA